MALHKLSLCELQKKFTAGEVTAVEIVRAYATDPALDRNFFAHPPHRVERIRIALRRKAEATLAITQRRMDAARGVPAAGAR